MIAAVQMLKECGGNQAEAARRLGLNRMTYRNRLDTARHSGLFADADDYRTWPAFQDFDVKDGAVIVASDGHVWPFARSVSAEALIAISRAVKPRVIIANGDFVDGARSNRHDPDGWNKRPSVKEELEGVQALLHDWRMAAGRGVQCAYTIGNHEKNFERKLVAHVKEFEGVPGFRLQEHLADWPISVAVRINWNGPDPVMVKHRHRGGDHAGYNNTLRAGVTMVTGHTHLLEAKPFGDYRGRRWGVQTGCLTAPDGPQFEYAEMGPSSACEGFAVLTFVDGELMTPELCEVRRGRAWFRGKVWAEAERAAA